MTLKFYLYGYLNRVQSSRRQERVALREWAFVKAHLSSDKRKAELQPRLQRCNRHRPHGGIQCRTPVSRLGLTENTL